MESAKARLVELAGGRYVVRWIDPRSGRTRQKNAQTNDRREAEHVRREVENRIASGHAVSPEKISWQEFRDLFDEHKLPELAPRSGMAYDAAFNLVERTIKVEKLRDLTGPRIDYLKKRSRERGLLDTTIAKHLRHIKAALRWANRRGYLLEVPNIEMPKRARGAKAHGRSLNASEIEALLEAVPAVVGLLAAPAWQRLLQGALLSGMRRSELLNLSWDSDGDPHIEVVGGEWMIRFSRESQKSNRDELWATPPGFARLLAGTIPSERRGRVFKFGSNCKQPEHRSDEWVSRVVSKIGKTAGIVVAIHPITKKKKYASLHDLRRTFATSWAQRVPASILRALMRHDSVQTTEDFYVGLNAVAMAQFFRENEAASVGAIRGEIKEIDSRG